MKMEDYTKVINDIKTAESDVERSKLLADLVSDYEQILNVNADLTSKNEQLQKDNVEYAQLNNQLFLKIGGNKPQVQEQEEQPKVEPISYDSLKFD